MSFIEPLNSDSTGDDVEQMKSAANKLMLMAENPENQHILEAKFRQWLDLMEQEQPDRTELATIQLLINAFGTAVVRARAGEQELARELDELLHDNSED